MCKPEIGIARITQNHRGELDRLESEKMEFHQKVYQGYLAVQKKFPTRIQMIDGEKTKEEVRLDALDIVLRFIGEN